MKRVAVLMVLLASCGGGGTPGARFGADSFEETAGVELDSANTVDLDELDLLDELDRIDLDLDGDSAITLDLDELDTLDELDRQDQLDRDLGDPLDLDGGADAYLPCGGLCSQYQLCVEETGQCQENDLCRTEFCAGEPENAEKTAVEGKLTWVDRYEWPNVQGQLPQGGFGSVGAAVQACLSVGKRLCTVAELSAGCSAGSKYPYGSSYDGTACNTELPYQVRESGAFPGCHAGGSEAFDLVGNLSEWTIDGKLFGGTVQDGLDATCQKEDPPPELLDFTFVGLRCCLSPTDDLDGDGTQASLDCEDLDKEIHPGATEACDGRDNDCDGQTDDTEDKDQDGFNLCADCNDKAFSIHPGAPDQLGDGVDANCDGIDGIDLDQDGVVAKESGGADCNDQNPAVKPGASEICDGQDNDCDGAIDSPLPAGTCDDGSLCTADACDSAGKGCAHVPISCDDKNPCTDDGCQPELGCVHSSNNAVCSDNNLCTEDDQCLLGDCRGQPKHCEDGNPCTDDACDPATGACTHTANAQPCEDADPCTTGDFCQAKACKPGDQKLLCNDGNDCTTDECKPGEGCRYTPRQGTCQDGDDCTTNDYCLNGYCTGGTNTCECAKDQDCAAREDGNWCNGTLYCNLQKMPRVCEVKPGTEVICKPDGDTFCAKNTCDPKVGKCLPSPRNEGLPCEKPCTVSPICNGGVCQGTSCTAAGMTCVSDVCIPNVCTANTRVCDGLFSYKSCNAGGTGWSASAPCGVGQYCDLGQCKSQICKPGVVACLGNLAGTCNDSGSNLQAGYTNCQDLPATPYCQGGVCIGCAPACSGKTCGDNGCGGTCGECGQGFDCTEGQCVPRWTMVAAGTYSTCALKGAGDAWCWGGNNSGILGDGSKLNKSAPGRVGLLSEVGYVRPGSSHVCAVKKDGTAWCWGSNAYGQLGDGSKTDRSTPVQVGAFEGAATIAPGLYHTCAMKKDGTVWCWGYNGNGQLGDGTTTAQRAPIRVSGLEGATAIGVGASHSCAVLAGGSVWCWGGNANGQLGDATKESRSTPVQVSGMNGAIDVSLGAGHSCALKSNSTLWCWGNNTAGQLGDGTQVDKLTPVQVSGWGNVVAVSAGDYHTCAVWNDATATCWGRNNFAQLGDGTKVLKTIPVKVSGLSGVVSVTAGSNHSCAMKDDGTIWCWGVNSSGQLGNGTLVESSVPVQTCADETCSGTLAWQDPATGLFWQKTPTTPSYAQPGAKTYCSGLILGGLTGWHLPTVSEYRTLIRSCMATASDGFCGVKDTCLASSCRDSSCAGCGKNMGPAAGCYWPDALAGSCADPFWTSSVVSNVLTNAWSISFAAASVDSTGNSFSTAVRCVRSTP